MRLGSVFLVCFLSAGCPRPNVVSLTECDGGACETCTDCSTECELPRAQGVLEAGQCVISACLPTYGDCNQQAQDGCEMQLTSAAHCGACDKACNTPPSAVCVDQQLQTFWPVGACRDGRCDYTTFFETCAHGCDGGQCLPSPCGSTEDNPNHCGACDNVCQHAGAASLCMAGQCRLGPCLPGFENCDGDESNGCETSLNSSSHCGACNHVCDADGGEVECRNGTCEVSACSPFYENCDADASNGCETYLGSVTHCGACNKSCGFNEICAFGAFVNRWACIMSPF